MNLFVGCMLLLRRRSMKQSISDYLYFGVVCEQKEYHAMG